jgi:hypothetical protein
MLKPPNHTVSVADVGFIGAYYGMVTMKVGEIDYCSDDGHSVVLKNGGGKIHCDIIIKCTGFHFNRDVTRITGKKMMYASAVLSRNCGYVAESLLDGAQFARHGSEKSNKDIMSAIYDSSAAAKVIGELIDDPDFGKAYGNPFGSSYMGFCQSSTKYFAFMAQNTEKFQKLFQVFGPPTLPVVEAWISHSINAENLTKMHIVENLAALARGEGMPYPVDVETEDTKAILEEDIKTKHGI